ncbi:hypothetical protein EDD63_15010 [Breznakia blatticola]|uniref:Uncharacterized protein n=1 Tax=Breznakia blatticola TaxID=1754012 RepID=A0A4R7ZCC0_9FIRM|nr:MobP3 family relaxase [Breznakia blatticola]TDW13104.1 hypothetical protein EDD63_15010 [Breznakia blatticola]
MARLIMYSDFLSNKEKPQILNSLEYIAKREGVEINGKQKLIEQKYDLKGLVTKKQEELITEVVTKYPDTKELLEYQEYTNQSTKQNASNFITMATQRLEELAFTNADYMKYISERPGVEINENDTHGLFNKDGVADLSHVKSTFADHQGVVWRDVISLRREDAIEVGLDSREAWQKMLSSHMNKKAELLGIPQDEFHWCAAFHDESFHPHVHVMSWSDNLAAGYQDVHAIEKFKSVLANDIFENEMWLAKELKNEVRIDLETEYKNKLDEIVKDASIAFVGKSEDENINPIVMNVENKLVDLSSVLKEKGSRVYGYQTAEAKDKTDDLVSYLLHQEELRPLLKEYVESNQRLVEFYKKDTSQFAEEFLNKMIHPEKGDRKVLHNAVVAAAYEIKDANYSKQIVYGEQLHSLNQKLSEYTVPHDVKDKEKLALAISKVGFLQEKNLHEIVEDLKPLIDDEEKAMEIMLDAKDNSLLTKTETRMINNAYDERIDEKVDFENYEKTNESIKQNVAESLIMRFMTFLSNDTNEHNHELKRIQSIKAEDRMLIRHAQKQRR